MLFGVGFVGRQVVAGGGGLGGPSLALDFTTGTLDPRITFTRASIGTYYDVAGVLQTATTNTPRWDYDPVTHVMRGLLIEEQRINSMLQSGDFTNAAWNKGNCTLSAGTTGPNGAVTGSGMISNNGLTGLLSENSTSVAGTTYTSSCFVRSGTLSSVTMLMPLAWWADAANRVATYNLSTGIVTQVQGGTATATMVPVGGGWYRVSLTATPDLSASGAVRFAGASAVGDGVSVQHYAFGAQLEVGAFATSYIPTTAAAVTRSADLASMPTGAWFSAASGTYQAEFNPSGLPAGLPSIISGNAGSPTIATGGDARLASAIRAVVAVFSATGPQYTFGAVNKAAFAYLSGASRAAVNGTAFGPNATAFSVTGTVVEFGSDGVTPGAAALNGYLRRVQYWPRALSNTELQQVTT